MRSREMLPRYWSLVVVGSITAPLAACAILALFRDSMAATNAGLVLVLLIVAAASTGIRVAGISAALAGAVGFDYFLTEPYDTLNISDRADIETTVLLLLIGAAVTELALWGRRQQSKASREQGYLEGVVRAAAGVAAGGASTQEFIEEICRQIVDVLDIDRCYYDPDTRSGLPVVDDAGTLIRAGHPVDVGRRGLPTDTRLALAVTNAGVSYGHLVLTAATRVAKPSLNQLQVAATLANQIAVALAGDPGRRARDSADPRIHA